MKLTRQKIVQYVASNFCLNYVADLSSVIEVFQERIPDTSSNWYVQYAPRTKDLPSVTNDIHGQLELFPYTQPEGYWTFDVIGAIFFLLSGWAEVSRTGEDPYSRYTFGQSIEKEWNTHQVPLVNVYYDRLSHWLTTRVGISCQPVVRHQHLLYTQDIDHIRAIRNQYARHYFKKGNILSGLLALWDYTRDKHIIHKINKLDNFIFSNTKESYFFILLDTSEHESGAKNGDYHEKELKSYLCLFKHIVRLGLHGPFGTDKDLSSLQSYHALLDPLGVDPVNRFHYLCFDPYYTPTVLEKAGIVYDFSLGFNDQVGFRRSTCTPYYLWKWDEQKMSTTIEIPLIIMDVSLFGNNYAAINTSKEAFESCRPLLEQLYKYHGYSSINFHNNYLIHPERTVEWELMEQIVMFSNQQ